MISSQRRALVIVLTEVRKDPRVQRQIAWLDSEGWGVDSLGLGTAPELVGSHFQIADRPRWTTTRWGRGLFHALLTNRAKFRTWATSLFPAEVGRLINSGVYDTIIFNDIDLIAWVDDAATFAGHSGQIHLDMHEFFPPRLTKGSWRRFRVESYYRWTRAFINHPRFTSRSVVASAIGDLYRDEFHIASPSVVRNCPPGENLTPHAVDAANIKLLYHGGAMWPRGLRQILDAAPLLDERFSVTFMLTGPATVVEEVRQATQILSDRVSVVPAVAMPEVAKAINSYDLEVMFYPPVTQNLLLALPNKLFEAIQGRLGLVVGSSPMMREVVESTGNGLVVSGWESADLANALNALSADDVARMKQASHASASQFSAEHEKQQFFAMLDQQA